VLDIKAVSSGGIKVQMKAEVNNQQGMFDEIVTQLLCVDQAFLDADEKGFDVSAHGMARSATRRTLLLPVFDERPIKQREERAIVSHHWIILYHLSQGGLVIAV